MISLREAVSYANSHGGNEQIVFAPNLAGHTIALTGGELALTDITGTTTILGANQMTVSGNNASRMFNIGSGATVEISGLTIANGYVGGVGGYGTSASGGGIFNSGTLALTDCAISACTSTGDVNADGGGIYNDGALTIANSTIAANSAAPLNCFGGGIYNAPDGSLTITESTISGNSVYAGGGIYNDGDLTITDSTISGNSVANAGGGLFNAESSTMRITDCTIANNSAVFGGGGICNEYTIVISNCTIAGNSAVDFGGGILNYGTATLSDTLMSGNSNIGSTSPDILGTVTANYSLIRNAAGVILSDSSAGNITGVDPLLGTLGDYGGPTQTMPLLPGSPAIDAGSNALAVDSHGNPLTTDQHGLGFARIVNSTVNIGAYESSWDTTPPTVTINQASGQADPTNGSPINFTVVFSELVSDFSTGDVALSGTAGATTAIVTNPSGDQVTYNVAVSGMTGDGTVIASVAAGVAHDAAGNSNDPSTSTDNTVTYDTTFPTVTIEGISIAGTGPPRGRILAFEVVFSEAVSDFTIDDVTLSGTAPGKSITSFSGSFTTYDVFVSGMTGSGTVTVSVAAGVAHDAAGNPNLASTDCTAIYNAPGYDFNDDGIADVLLQNQSTGEVGALAPSKRRGQRLEKAWVRPHPQPGKSWAWATSTAMASPTCCCRTKPRAKWGPGWSRVAARPTVGKAWVQPR